MDTKKKEKKDPVFTVINFLMFVILPVLLIFLGVGICFIIFKPLVEDYFFKKGYNLFNNEEDDSHYNNNDVENGEGDSNDKTQDWGSCENYLNYYTKFIDYQLSVLYVVQDQFPTGRELNNAKQNIVDIKNNIIKDALNNKNGLNCTKPELIDFDNRFYEVYKFKKYPNLREVN